MTRPPLDVAPRASRVRESLDEAGCGALVVDDLTNVRWLCGFVGTAGRVVLLPDDLVLVTDGRYAEQARAQLAEHRVDGRVVEGRTPAEQDEAIRALLRGVARVGLEADHVTWAAQRAYAELLAPAELVPTSGLVEFHRAVKDAGEIARIEEAARLAEAALAAVLDLLGREPTEAELALALDDEMRHRGAEGPSFPTIVASGPNSGRPHHRPGARRLQEGDLVVIDFGALVDGYCSDMTRTTVLGEPSAEQQELLALVHDAEAAGVAAVRPGIEAKVVDAASRDLIARAGWGDHFVHGTGHGVGLRIHEAPWVNPRSTEILVPGHVLTVEPGVYRSGFGGVRVEDTVLVTGDGCRPLTTTPKDLACLRSRRTTSRTG